MTAVKWANAALEGGGCPRLGFVHSLHVDVGPVKLGEVALATGAQRPASATRRRRRDGAKGYRAHHTRAIPIG